MFWSSFNFFFSNLKKKKFSTSVPFILMYRPTQFLVQRSVSNQLRSFIQRRNYTNGGECKINLEQTSESAEKLT